MSQCPDDAHNVLCTDNALCHGFVICNFWILYITGWSGALNESQHATAFPPRPEPFRDMARDTSATSGFSPRPSTALGKITTLAVARSSQTTIVQDKKGRLSAGTLTTTLEVWTSTSAEADYKCVKAIEALFYYRPVGASSKVPIGHASCNLIDMTARDARGQKLYLKELVNSRYGKFDVPEVVMVPRTIYSPKGHLRKSVKEHGAWLKALVDAEKLLHIDTLKIHEAYRGMGFGPKVLAAMHDLLPQLSRGYAFHGMVVLSPCTISDDTDKYRQEKDLEPFQQELVLRAFYARSGYSLLTEGTESADGTVTVMGRMV